jgi:hypothetical protein
MFRSLARMSKRKPRLDWIRKVLVDFGTHHAGDAPPAIAFAPTVVPFSPRSRSNHREAHRAGVLLRPAGWPQS